MWLFQLFVFIVHLSPTDSPETADTPSSSLPQGHTIGERLELVDCERGTPTKHWRCYL